MSKLSGIVAIVWIFFVAEKTSHAQQANWNIHPLFGPDAVALGVAGLATLTSGVTFAVAEGVYAADESWLPPTWAKLQLVLAGAPITAAGASAVVLSARRDGELVEEGVLFTLIGAWFLVDGTLSLLYYQPTADARGSHSAGVPRLAHVSVLPLVGGGTVAYSGRF